MIRMTDTCKIIGCSNTATWNSHFCFDHEEDSEHIIDNDTCDEIACTNDAMFSSDFCLEHTDVRYKIDPYNTDDDTCKIIRCHNPQTYSSNICFHHEEDDYSDDIANIDSNNDDSKYDPELRRVDKRCEKDGCTNLATGLMDICPDCFTENMSDDESDTDTHVLDDAADAVYERADTHGAEDCFATIADMWATYLDVDVDEGDVCNMMILLKVARNKEGVYTDDNWQDIAGYAENGARVSE